jgi:hypothetical protein
MVIYLEGEQYGCLARLVKGGGRRLGSEQEFLVKP